VNDHLVYVDDRSYGELHLNADVLTGDVFAFVSRCQGKIGARRARPPRCARWCRRDAPV
jgi:hypothetical protein